MARRHAENGRGAGGAAWRARRNDRLAEIVKANPKRFAAFGILPTPDPKAAADELERTVTKLGFKGAMIHGLTNGLFIDDKRFWPIFERAAGARRADLSAPGLPAPGGDRGLLQGLSSKLSRAGRARRCGFTVETATQGVRIVL